MAVIYTQHYAQFFDANGDPLSGGKLYTYNAGTTDNRPTYTTAAATVENANPIILDAAGRATLFINGNYRFDVFDQNDVLVKSTDNVSSFNTDSTTTSFAKITDFTETTDAGFDPSDNTVDNYSPAFERAVTAFNNGDIGGIIVDVPCPMHNQVTIPGSFHLVTDGNGVIIQEFPTVTCFAFLAGTHGTDFTNTNVTSVSDTAVYAFNGANTNIETTELTVASSTGFKKGQDVLIASNQTYKERHSGFFGAMYGEIATIQSVTATTITLVSKTWLRFSTSGSKTVKVTPLRYRDVYVDVRAAANPNNNIFGDEGDEGGNPMFLFEGLQGQHIKIRFESVFGTGIEARSCTRCKFDIIGGEQPNLQTNDRRRGYLINSQGASQNNTYTVSGGKLGRHCFTTNVNYTGESSPSFVDANIFTHGNGKNNIVRGNSVNAGLAFDNHPLEYALIFDQCIAVNSFGGASIQAAGFQERGIGTIYRDCIALGGVIGFYNTTGKTSISGVEGDIANSDFADDYRTLYQGCIAIGQNNGNPTSNDPECKGFYFDGNSLQADVNITMESCSIRDVRNICIDIEDVSNVKIINTYLDGPIEGAGASESNRFVHIQRCKDIITNRCTFDYSKITTNVELVRLQDGDNADTIYKSIDDTILVNGNNPTAFLNNRGTASSGGQNAVVNRLKADGKTNPINIAVHGGGTGALNVSTDDYMTSYNLTVTSTPSNLAANSWTALSFTFGDIEAADVVTNYVFAGSNAGTYNNDDNVILTNARVPADDTVKIGVYNDSGSIINGVEVDLTIGVQKKTNFSVS